MGKKMNYNCPRCGLLLGISQFHNLDNCNGQLDKKL